MRNSWHRPAMELVNYQAIDRVALTANRGTVRLRWYPAHAESYAKVWLTPAAPLDAVLPLGTNRYLGELIDTQAHDEADRRFRAILGTERGDLGGVYYLNTDDFFEAVAFLAGDPNDWHQYPDGHRYVCWADMRENYFLTQADDER